MKTLLAAAFAVLIALPAGAEETQDLLSEAHWAAHDRLDRALSLLQDHCERDTHPFTPPVRATIMTYCSVAYEVVASFYLAKGAQLMTVGAPAAVGDAHNEKFRDWHARSQMHKADVLDVLIPPAQLATPDIGE